MFTHRRLKLGACSLNIIVFISYTITFLIEMNKEYTMLLSKFIYTSGLSKHAHRIINSKHWIVIFYPPPTTTTAFVLSNISDV